MRKISNKPECGNHNNVSGYIFRQSIKTGQIVDPTLSNFNPFPPLPSVATDFMKSFTV